jgi:ABC-2 type transport system ATP-binding protein
MPENVVLTENLTRRFGDFVAVDHINFSVAAGEIVGYLGPNGSGKTTTIRMLLGLLEPSEGKATVLGYDAFLQSEEVRARCGYMSQKFALYDDLTVNENLTFYGGIYGIHDPRRIKKTIGLVGLGGSERELVKGLSAGWRQRLAIGIALVHQPRLLFLDEPTSGVDPTARRAFWDLIYDLAAGGVTILVTTHYMDEAEYCGRVGIMREGKLLAIDTPTALKERAIPGTVWDAAVEPLGEALDRAGKCEGILRVGLAGDHLRIISRRGMLKKDLLEQLKRKRLIVHKLEKGDPSLEDVFLSLAR